MLAARPEAADAEPGKDDAALHCFFHSVSALARLRSSAVLLSLACLEDNRLQTDLSD